MRGGQKAELRCCSWLYRFGCYDEKHVGRWRGMVETGPDGACCGDRDTTHSGWEGDVREGGGKCVVVTGHYTQREGGRCQRGRR